MKTIQLHIASVGLAALAFTGLASAEDVTGAGSSFAQPLIAKWASAYNKATGARINYQSVGSGAGIKQIDAKTVDFGASDMPLTDDVLAKKGEVQFPILIGGVVPVTNIAGVAPGQLKLNGQLLADFDDTADVAIPHGFFGLQVHATKDAKLWGREVAFRNLRVLRLDGKK